MSRDTQFPALNERDTAPAQRRAVGRKGVPRAVDPGYIEASELRRIVARGLFVAWLIHDLEELATIRHTLASQSSDVSQPPFDPTEQAGLLRPRGRAHMVLAMTFMGILIAAAARAGERSGGRSRLFRSVLAGFGAHALVPHVLWSIVARRYTPGLITAVTVVGPFAWWARREVRSIGVSNVDLRWGELALIPATIGIAHMGAAATLAARKRHPYRRRPRP